VTLAGSGGVGKTRLAQQAAADALERNPGGTWWIELASINTSAQAGERLAAAIGVGSSSPSEVPDLIARHLRDAGSTLVVMDNAEHLVDAVADLAKHLLAACRDLRVLVTSREPLGIGGELVWRVPSLASPPAGLTDPARLLEHDAAELFVERARKARPNLSLDATAAAAIASICTRLDGIPLAIELAAARARSIPLDRLAAGLDDAFRLLTGGDRTATARQQTLLASIAWSVDLLDERDDAVLRRLAVFAGPFTLEAAETVAADEDGLVDRYDVIDALGQLVDKSLVQFDGSKGHYRLLETVRQFGVDRLRHHGELAELRTRHAHWCVEWAEIDPFERLGSDLDERLSVVPDLVAALDWATADQPDLALRIVAGLGPMLTIVGPSTCHRLADWLPELDRTSVTPEPWVGATAAIVGRAVIIKRPDVFSLIPAALAAGGPQAAPARRYLEMITQVTHGVQIGHFDEAVRLCEEAIAAGDDYNGLRFAGTIGAFGAFFGRLDLAHRYLPIVEEILGRRGLPWNPETAGLAHAGRVYTAALEGRLTDARAEATSDPSPSEYAFVSLSISVMVGVVSGDEALCRRALASMERYEPPEAVRLNVESSRCLVAYFDADPVVIDAAVTSLYNELKGRDEAYQSWADYVVPGLLLLGRTAEVRDVVDEQTSLFADCEDLQPLQVVIVHKAEALLARQQGRIAEATEAAHRQLDHSHRSGLVLYTIDALLQLAELADRREDHVEAARLAGAAAAASERTDYRAPLIGHLIDIGGLVSRLATEHPDAHAEGAGLDLDAAVELARRMRGPRGRPTTGWDSLTPTERLVADLAATGATNAQIAEHLLISVPTVKTHLTRVFTKLDITNRTQLANAAGRSLEPNS
jgi:predicted ATPase/DNA-binding CsgD family transcriptional regulator